MSSSQDPKDWMQDPATLTEEIDATREDVGETLDALQEKLSPSQLLDQSVSYLGQRGYELACSLRDAAREHPVPFALAAAGALWMMSRRAEDDVEIELDEELEPAESFEEFAAYGAPGGAGESVESAARRTAQRARSAADTAKARAARAASSVKEKTAHAKHAVGRKARRTSDEFSRLLREQPLLVGAIGLAIGATVAALVPVTDSEERVLGQKSEHLVRQAKQKASEQAERVRDKARRAAEAARSAIAEPDRVGGSSSGGNGSTTAQSGPGGSSAMP